MYRILMFSPGFAPYSFSENLVSSKLALAMLERGWQVEVISREDEGPLYGDHWTEPWLPLKRHTHEIRYDLGRPLIRYAQRAWDSVVLGHPIAGVRWARRALRLALRLHRSTPFDIVLSRSVSNFAHLPAIHFARRTGVPWLANWNDPPSYLFPPPYQSSGTRLRRLFWDRYFRESVGRATLNTFPTRRLAVHLYRHLGVSDLSKVRIVPHLAHDIPYPPSPQPNGVFGLCHAGNLSSERDPSRFLAALKRLLACIGSQARVRFEIIGVVDLPLRSIISKHGLEDVVTWPGRMDYLETLSRLAASSVLVVIEAPCEEGIFLPSKVADYVQVGKPILAVSPNEGAMRDLLSTDGGGLAVDCTSEDAIYQGLKHLYDAWRDGSLPSYRPDALCAKISSDAILRRYESLFHQVSGERPGVVRGP